MNDLEKKPNLDVRKGKRVSAMLIQESTESMVADLYGSTHLLNGSKNNKSLDVMTNVSNSKDPFRKSYIK